MYVINGIFLTFLLCFPVSGGGLSTVLSPSEYYNTSASYGQYSTAPYTAASAVAATAAAAAYSYGAAAAAPGSASGSLLSK